MLDRVHPPGRLRVTAAAVAAAALFGLASSAEAGPLESRRCRAQIAKEARQLASMGLRFVDQCHRNRDRICVAGSMRDECNFLPSGQTDPKGRYVARIDRAVANIAGKCTGDPVLDNYAGNVEDAIFAALSEEISGNSQVLLDGDDLFCDAAKAKCLRAIAQSRSLMMREVVNDSLKCQRDLDKGATSFGEIDPGCLDSGDRTANNATNRITRSCSGVNPADVGTCSPLPQCAIESAVLTGQSLAQIAYGQQSTCGDGNIDAGEQCDDGNTLAGDGCNGFCELEGNTCTPYGGTGGTTGTRVVKVSINTPESLAGLQVNLNYPAFQTGIPGLGTSSVVQGRLNPLQPAGLALVNDTDNDAIVGMINIADQFESGDLFEIAFDNCVTAATGVCFPAQYVVSCTEPPPACGTAPPPGVVGECSNPGGCPGGDCVDQTTFLTSCSVSDPVDELGQPVAGVTCSVSVTELP